MKVRISSWVFAAVYLFAGACSFVVLPRFRTIYQDLYGADLSLPFLTRLVLGITPLGWLLLACTLAALLIWKDVRGRSAMLPNWAALVILLASGLLVVVALFVPLIVDIDSMEAR
jgi:hypothetical protein